MDTVDVLLLVENQVGKLLAVMHENETVVMNDRPVVRRAFIYACEGAVNVVIRNIVFLAQVTVVQAQPAKPHAADRLCGIIIVNMLLIINILFVYASEFQAAESEHPASPSFLKRSLSYHFAGNLRAMQVPTMPPVTPAIMPPSTSEGKCTHR